MVTIPTWFLLKDGGEPIRGEHGIPRGTLLGFWRWAYSQTLDNALRGVLAECLGACSRRTGPGGFPESNGTRTM